MQKASLPKGTRDFGPAQMRGRNFIIDSIIAVYNKYGFMPIETPAMENLSTLSGKYGDEGDKLLYKILDSGDFLKKIDRNALDQVEARELGPKIASKGLRYDLTIPFARFVVQHQNELTFPFKRYQIQPVWRADRPQKGRYREFWQCDADIIGTDSLLSELDLICIYEDVFQSIGLPNYELRINHRSLLEAVAHTTGLQDHFKELTIAIDKLDKIGWDGVSKEIATLGANDEQLSKLQSLLRTSSLNQKVLEEISDSLVDSQAKTKGLQDLTEVVNLLASTGRNINISLDLTLARGLDYYTGCIFEAAIPDSGIGSVSGGGRYDNLTGVFGLKGMSGVGISFGIDRLYDVLESKGQLSEGSLNGKAVILCHFDSESRLFCVGVCNQLRAQGIQAEVYPDIKKIKKQFDYAHKRGFKHVVVVGTNEMEEGIVQHKDMDTGQQTSLTIPELTELLS